MAQIPEIFPTVPPSAIASYSYTDIAEGTGVVTFYGANTVDNAVTKYVLSTVPVYSNDKLTVGAGGEAASDDIRVNAPFDVVFNLPQNIKGKLTAQVSWIQGHTTSAGGASTGYVIVKVIHVDSDSQETPIAQNIKSDTHDVPTLESKGKTVNIEINITSNIHFEKGETLRITVELWNSTSNLIALCHDPKDRVITAAEYGSGIDLAPETTQLIVNVPFRLEL